MESLWYCEVKWSKHAGLMRRVSDDCQGDLDSYGGDPNLECSTEEQCNQLQGKMGTAMTVTICPNTCFDSRGLAYALANTVPHCCSRRTVELFRWPVMCNGCVSNTTSLYVGDHTALHSLAYISTPAAMLHACTGLTSNS